MAAAILVLLYSAFVGTMGYLFYLGLKSAVFGGGYWLFGGRESFGWGARLAGVILMVPLLASIVYWIVALATGYVTGEELARGQKFLAPLLLGGLSSVIGFVVSYVLGEFTYTPYWVFSRQGEDEHEDGEELSEKEKKRRLQKLERKRAKARALEERLRREREEEEERLRRRHEQAKTKKAPPPLPLSNDDRERGRRS